MDLRHEIVSGSVQAVPAATLVGVHILGMTLPEWAAVAGIAFVGVQAVVLAWRTTVWWLDRKAGKTEA